MIINTMKKKNAMYIYTVMKDEKKKIMKREVTGFAENYVSHQICVHVPLPASNTHMVNI